MLPCRWENPQFSATEVQRWRLLAVTAQGHMSFTQFERLIARDPGGRGAGALVVPGDLELAARALASAQRLVIATGFPVAAPGGPVPETDGPPGAVAVARALEQLGQPVQLLTELTCAGAVGAAARAAGLAAPVLLAPVGGGAWDSFAAEFWDHVRPDCLLAVERPGAASDGCYRSMRGVELSGVAPIDTLFAAARAHGVTTVAVGDGGNEVGMGKVTQRVTAAVPHGDRIAATVATDYLVVAGCSNWGAYALVAALSLLSGRHLLPAATWEAEVVGAMVAAGAVDGVTHQSTATVDHLPGAETAAVLAGLNSWLAK